MTVPELAPERTKRTLKQKLRIGVALGAICLPVVSGGIVGQYNAAKDQREKKEAKLNVAAGYESCAQLVDGFTRSGKVTVPLSAFNEREKTDCGFGGLIDTNTQQKYPVVAGGHLTSDIHINHTVTLPKAAELRSEAAHITDVNRDMSSGIDVGKILFGGVVGLELDFAAAIVALAAYNKRTTGSYLV